MTDETTPAAEEIINALRALAAFIEPSQHVAWKAADEIERLLERIAELERVAYEFELRQRVVTSDEIEALREIASTAREYAPGDWEFRDDDAQGLYVTNGQEMIPHIKHPDERLLWDLLSDGGRPVLAHIAAFDPPTVLRLLARIAEMERDIKKMERHGRMRADALFRAGDFIAHSGVPLRWKIECDALGDEDWRCLALIASERLPPFGSVEGVPRGGLAFAAALHPYATIGPLLIADDVCTTGRSLEGHRRGREALGVVAFARGDRCPAWVRPLFACSERR